MVEDKRYHRGIKSFVRHQGRLTEGQKFALLNHSEQYYLNQESLSPSAFNHYDKIVLEIGFGYGDSLLEMAKAAPDTLFIGIEVHRPGIGRLLMKAYDEDVHNIKVFEGDAVDWIDRFCPDDFFSRVQIFFPDPWHKKRHVKRRLVQHTFCRSLYRVLKSNGKLHIATDWQPYAEHCLEVLQSEDGFINESNSDYIDKPSYRPITKFERRGIKLGHSIFDIIFTKI